MSETTQIIDNLNKKISKLTAGVWATTIITIISVIIRLSWPTFVVANPPTSNKPYWQIGPSNMLTVNNVADLEHISEEEVVKLIKENKITPIPIIVDEHNITWAIPKNYKIQ